MNKLTNDYLAKTNIQTDLTVYCRLFDMKINNNLEFYQIEKEINKIYSNPNIIYGSSDTFFLGSKKAINYLFSLALLYKETNL